MFEPDRLPPQDEYGYLDHPDLPQPEEGHSILPLLDNLGFEASFVPMDGDAPQDVVDSYFEAGAPDAAARWTPTPPAPGWLLASKFETEDGPFAMFVRPVTTLAQRRGRIGKADVPKGDLHH